MSGFSAMTESPFGSVPSSPSCEPVPSGSLKHLHFQNWRPREENYVACHHSSTLTITHVISSSCATSPQKLRTSASRRSISASADNPSVQPRRIVVWMRSSLYRSQTVGLLLLNLPRWQALDDKGNENRRPTTGSESGAEEGPMDEPMNTVDRG